MLNLRLVISIFLVGMMIFCQGSIFGQAFPNKPIRLITTAAGGGSDFVARLIAQGLAASPGQQAIVENRGGSVVNSAQTVAKAPADGYTLLLWSGALWTVPFIQDVPYDPVKDFSPITLAVSAANILVVNPSLPVKSVKELIALAKAKPGEINYASGATGGSPHLSAELFKAMAGVNIVRINYKGSGPSISDLIVGQVQLTFATGATVAPHVKSGRLRALAVTSAQPAAAFPGLPTVAASGLPGYESVVVNGILAPAGTPAPLINRLNNEIVRVLNRADVKERHISAGWEVVGSSPEVFAAFIKSEMASMGKVIKDAGIRAE